MLNYLSMNEQGGDDTKKERTRVNGVKISGILSKHNF